MAINSVPFMGTLQGQLMGSRDIQRFALIRAVLFVLPYAIDELSPVYSPQTDTPFRSKYPPTHSRICRRRASEMSGGVPQFPSLHSCLLECFRIESRT